MTNQIIKAERAVIVLGSIELEVFMLPDTSFRLSQTQVAEAVGKDAKRNVSEFLKSKSPEALPFKDFTFPKTKIEGSKMTVTLIPIELVAAYWTKEAISGNILAARLLGACAAESIERRANKAFNQILSDEEENKRLAARTQGKTVRRQLTDAIRDYLARHDELSPNDRKWIYTNASEFVNLAVFGRKAKKLSEELGCKPTEIRDVIKWEVNLALQELENTATRRIDELDEHPLQAIREAAKALMIKPLL